LAFVTPLSDGSAAEPEPSAHESAPPQLSLVGEEPRRHPSTIGGAFYLGILVVTVLALVVVGLGHWRGGVHIMAAAMAAAAVMRALLPRRDTGMLEVRSRWFDVSLLGAVAIALWVLASTIPSAS
jgi:hypothetical protein